MGAYVAIANASVPAAARVLVYKGSGPILLFAVQQTVDRDEFN